MDMTKLSHDAVEKKDYTELSDNNMNCTENFRDKITFALIQLYQYVNEFLINEEYCDYLEKIILFHCYLSERNVVFLYHLCQQLRIESLLCKICVFILANYRNIIREIKQQDEVDWSEEEDNASSQQERDFCFDVLHSLRSCNQTF